MSSAWNSDPIVEKVTSHCYLKGAIGLREFCAQLWTASAECNHVLSFDEFHDILCGIPTLTRSDILYLAKANIVTHDTLDRLPDDTNFSVQVLLFIQCLRVSMAPWRKCLVDNAFVAFASYDSASDTVDLTDLRESFQDHCGATGADFIGPKYRIEWSKSLFTPGSSRVVREEFACYWAAISRSVPDDDDFAVLIVKCYGLPQETPTRPPVQPGIYSETFVPTNADVSAVFRRTLYPASGPAIGPGIDSSHRPYAVPQPRVFESYAPYKTTKASSRDCRAARKSLFATSSQLHPHPSFTAAALPPAVSTTAAFFSPQYQMQANVSALMPPVNGRLPATGLHLYDEDSPAVAKARRALVDANGLFAMRKLRIALGLPDRDAPITALRLSSVIRQLGAAVPLPVCVDVIRTADSSCTLGGSVKSSALMHLFDVDLPEGASALLSEYWSRIGGRTEGIAAAQLARSAAGELAHCGSHFAPPQFALDGTKKILYDLFQKTHGARQDGDLVSFDDFVLLYRDVAAALPRDDAQPLLALSAALDQNWR